MIKLIYTELLGEFGVPKTTLCRTLFVLFPPLKCSSLKHLWDLIKVGKVMSQTVKEVFGVTIIKNRLGRPTSLLRYKEA